MGELEWAGTPHIDLCHGLVVRGPDVVGTPAPSRRVRLTVAYLVVHRDRDVAASELADVLWGPVAPPSWRSSLREVLTRVRSYLASTGVRGAVTSREQRVRLRLEVEPVVDVEQLQIAARRVQQEDARAFPPAQLDALAELVGIRGTDVLPGDEGPWIDAVRRAVDQARSALGNALIVLLLEARRSEDALALSRALLQEDPLDERWLVSAMRALLACGRRGEALQLYDRTRRLLADELGIDPSRAAQALHLLALQDDTGPMTADPANPAEPAIPEPSADCPGDGRPPLLPFTGRGIAVHTVLSASRTAVVVVRGERGVGRTRLLRECAHALIPGTPAILHECAGPLHPLLHTDTSGPFALLVDDVQDADGGTLQTLLAVAREVHRQDVAIVLAERGGPSAPLSAPVRALHRVAPVRVVPLGTLTAAEVERASLGTVSPRIARRLLHRSGGLPLFVDAMAKEASEDVDPTGPVAAAVADLLADLSRPARELLLLAAVLGPSFPADELLYRVPPTAAWDPVDALEELFVHDLVELHDIEVRFRHDVVRHVLLRGPVGRRADLRRVLAARTLDLDAADPLDLLASP